MAFLTRVFSALVALTLTVTAHATIVRFDTSEGSFDVNLFDQDTPVTVSKFLGYVRAGEYDGSFIHLLEPGVLVQGGGYIYDLDSASVTEVVALAPALNEPLFSNVRATIAMAKLSGLPDSATNQWFINLADNSTSLDVENEGFTVFGQVIDDGMTTVDNIASFDTFDLFDDFLFTELNQTPLRDYTDTTVAPDESHFVEIYSVIVVDDAEDSASNIEPTLNTSQGGDSGGGGSAGAVLLLFALGFFFTFGFHRKSPNLIRGRAS